MRSSKIDDHMIPSSRHYQLVIVEVKSASRFGAGGLVCCRRFSCPALLGNVGNIAVGFGRGSSVKYSWLNNCFAEGRLAGSSCMSARNRSIPFSDIANLVSKLFFVRCDTFRGRAFGRRRHCGQVSSGSPHNSKICTCQRLRAT